MADTLESDKKDPQETATVTAERSWGDRFKKGAFATGTYFGFNGVFNLLMSVYMAYAFEPKADPFIKKYADRWGAKIAARTGLNEARIVSTLFMGPKGILLSGGTLLLPAIKWLEDHRRRLEFKIGHVFDRLQEALGMGNSASKSNLADYDKIKQAARQGYIDLTPEETQRLHAKHHLEVIAPDTLAFMEHRISWIKILTARISALITTSFGMNSLLGAVGLKEMLHKSGPRVTSAINKVMPWYGRVLRDPDSFSRNLADDVILTAAAATTHKVAQDFLHKETHDIKEETADMKHKIKIRSHRNAQEPGSFSAREQSKLSGAQPINGIIA